MRGFSGRLSRRVIVGVLAAALVASATPAAVADTKTEISIAEKRLKWLVEVVSVKRARVASIQESIRAVASEIRAGDDALHLLEREQKRRDNELIDTMARYDLLREQMRIVSSEAYMRGPADYLGILLDADSVADAGDAELFMGIVLSRNRHLAAQTAHAAKQIAELKARGEAMIERRAALLLTLRTRRDAILNEFAESQSELEEISEIREEVQQLLVTLNRRLRAEEEAAFGGTMPYGQWAQAFLDSIGAPAVRGNLVALVAWQLAEGTMARWNPLATTWRMPGSTPFNGHRVQNYVSLEQGLEATRKTLSRPGHGYEAILSSLAGGEDAMTTARAVNASDWCRGCAGGQYVVELIPTVERYYERYASRRG